MCAPPTRMNAVRTLLESSPLLALFLAIATGYAVGQISFAGVSFGAGAVLFTGLIIGAFAPKAAPPALVGTLGLLMFVYGVGIQYGPQFFAGLRGPGVKYIALTTWPSSPRSWWRQWSAGPLGVSLATAAGLFAGAGTSTPCLQAALVAAGNEDPAVGYAVAYPFGVLGPIVLMTLMAACSGPSSPARPERPVVELTVGPTGGGRRTRARPRSRRTSRSSPSGRRHERPADPETRLRDGDGLLLSAARRASRR